MVISSPTGAVQNGWVRTWPRTPLRFAFEGRADLGGAGLGVYQCPGAAVVVDPRVVRSCVCAWLKREHDQVGLSVSSRPSGTNPQR